MPNAYEFFEHTADIGVHIYGATLEELFRNAAAALFNALGELKKTESVREKTLELQADSLEDLLHDWLTEMLYEIESTHILYDEVKFSSLTPLNLRATIRGAQIDFAKSKTNEEIKAITYHQLRVEQVENATWRATVILDV